MAITGTQQQTTQNNSNNPNDLSALDFAAIKERIKSHYQNDPRFTDYDFEGSTISLLLDILAYITHYQGIHAHLAFSERFLDSATLRASVVSIAKELGYLPRQAQAATASIKLSFPKSVIENQIAPQTLNDTTFIVKSGLTFNASNTDGDTFIFTCLNDSSVGLEGTDFVGTFELKQGVYVTERFRFDSTNGDILFTLSNNNIDIDTITVKVKDTPDLPDYAGEVYTRTTDITTISPLTPAFFLQENSNGGLDIYFGDNVVGKQPLDNSEIVVTYLRTDGSLANGVNTFQINTPIQLTANGTIGVSIQPQDITITTISKAQGGSDREEIESIKHYAPMFYQTQDRAVTENDYIALLNKQFGWIQSINVWGGEKNNPPRYGQVYISINPTYGNKLTLAHKNEVLKFLDTKKMIGMIINIVDPEIIFVNFDVNYRYRLADTSDSLYSISDMVKSNVDMFFLNVSGLFKTDIKYSRLLNEIDNSHNSIDSNVTTITLSYKFTPTPQAANYTIDFVNPIKPGSVVSKEWVGLDGKTRKFVDDGAGNLTLLIDNEQDKFFNGTIDYANGVIVLTQFSPDTVDQELEIIMTPQSNNVSVKMNKIFAVGEVNITGEAI